MDNSTKQGMTSKRITMSCHYHELNTPEKQAPEIASTNDDITVCLLPADK
jgi:hypothetical protein